MHIAPERALSTLFESHCGDGYDPVDLDPSGYKHTAVRKFDLISDSPSLPTDTYDLILHSHVLEHVPCSLAHILYHLTRALRPDGTHIFAVPIFGGYYDAYYGPLPPDVARARFRQDDHVRLFGLADFDRHLGLIMRLPRNYSLYEYHARETLDRHNIPESARNGLHSNTVFVTGKSDYLLQPATATA